MKYALIALFALVFVLELSFPVNAIPTPPVDEVDFMMARIQKNLQMASEVTKIAQSKSAALVAQKVEEKKELKEAVQVAEEKIEKMVDKVEMLQVKMIGSGVDTKIGRAHV